MKEIYLKTSDNVNISVNHYFGEYRTVVTIICPGWFMCKDSKAFKAISKAIFDFTDVICMDFRGHGKSSGFFTFTSKEYMDIVPVVEYAKEQYSHIILMGFSFGGASSIIYTSKYKDIDTLIAVSAPADQARIENHCYKKDAWWPTLKKIELWRWLSIRPGNIFMPKIKPIDVVKNISPIPIHLITGTQDPTVYPWHSNALFEAALEPKTLDYIEQGIHAEDLFLDYPEQFMFFLKQYIP
jgi:pimeloyl-ACP methyl ester carboxylesterase